MPRRAAGPRLYLRRGRIDRRTGKCLPDVWVVRDGPREISTGCFADGPSIPDAAEQALGAYLAAKRQDGPPEPADRKRDPAQVLIVEVLAAYAGERAPKLAIDPATVRGFIQNLEAWWDERPLAEVKRSTCQAYIAHRMAMPDARYKDAATAPRVSERTATRELDILGGAIDWWHGEHTLTAKPIVWRPEQPESPRDALTRDQAARLLKAALGYRMDKEGRWARLGASARANRAHLRRFLLIGLYTGTRHAVIRRLLWEESATDPWIDLEAGAIYRRGRNEREARNKRRPVVKLPRRLAAHLARWKRLDEKAKLETNAVLHHGGHALAGKVRSGFEGCVTDAALPAEVTPHWMRHSAATWLMESGCDIWAAAGYLGMTVQTLEEHYGHHRPGYQAGAAKGIVRGT
jgi:site-specific recombinase XerC